jgi:hypothetical protein
VKLKNGKNRESRKIPIDAFENTSNVKVFDGGKYCIYKTKNKLNTIGGNRIAIFFSVYLYCIGSFTL